MNKATAVAKKVIQDHPDLKDIITPFLFQAMKLTPCSDKSNRACSFKPLTPAEFDQLAKLQPYMKNIDRSNNCNFAQFGYAEWEEAKADPSFPAAKPMLEKFM